MWSGGWFVVGVAGAAGVLESSESLESLESLAGRVAAAVVAVRREYQVRGERARSVRVRRASLLQMHAVCIVASMLAPDEAGRLEISGALSGGVAPVLAESWVAPEAAREFEDRVVVLAGQQVGSLGAEAARAQARVGGVVLALMCGGDATRWARRLRARAARLSYEDRLALWSRWEEAPAR